MSLGVEPRPHVFTQSGFLLRVVEPVDDFLSAPPGQQVAGKAIAAKGFLFRKFGHRRAGAEVIRGRALGVWNF
ncbi:MULTISPECIES: hypothetical protein [unclassified Pseudomonas]|uniref:hypothetical protein n=1 Tax=unclassified Pseudomonas TaxID=196821 RepID=UPI0012FD3897|nr:MULTISPECIES: hypothetical protein [unclassified Pseudomonas]MCU1740044.1 hypothetical protein [Pseudomonas sp. 20S_6.2_Bac1]